MRISQNIDQQPEIPAGEMKIDGEKMIG